LNARLSQYGDRSRLVWPRQCSQISVGISLRKTRGDSCQLCLGLFDSDATFEPSNQFDSTIASTARRDVGSRGQRYPKRRRQPELKSTKVSIRHAQDSVRLAI